MSVTPRAVWSGERSGCKVYVLDDGRRLIDKADSERLIERLEAGTLSIEEARALIAFCRGRGLPS